MQALLNIGPELTPESEAVLQKASPFYHVHKGMPPILLIHGTSDQQVPYEQSVAMMRKKLKAAGVDADLFTVPEGAHGMGSWDRLAVSGEWKKYLVDWLRTKLK
jgi:dipeptidyl aminopeptidase/acylaminoacyl peptidase